MRRDRLTVAIPSVVFSVLAVEYGKAVVSVSKPHVLIMAFLVVNVYMLGVAQVARIRKWDPYRYLWVFSAYVFVPFFVRLCRLLGLPPLLGPFFSFSTSVAVEYALFRDVFLKLDLARLVVLILTVRGLVNWLIGCSGCL